MGKYSRRFKEKIENCNDDEKLNCKMGKYSRIFKEKIVMMKN